MPRENRKRGKKRRREDDRLTTSEAVQPPDPESRSSKPSWIVPAPREPSPKHNSDAPFGYIDADVKAYFRTVDIQIRACQDRRVDEGQPDDDSNPSEERRMFFAAALTEISGKERQLSTDPESSIILERMIYSMDDFVRRVFADSLAGSYEGLVKHRFASHVCQTLFNVAADTVSREYQNIYPSVPESPEKGQLLTMTQLVLNACDELLTTFASLVMDPFASHVIRALLLLLYSPLDHSRPTSRSANKSQSVLRSKKSAAWKARQGPLRSVFSENRSCNRPPVRNVPTAFIGAARKFVYALRDELSGNEIRALAANNAASPVLQLLLEVEADQKMAAMPGSLMDQVMVGIITACQECSTKPLEPSDFIVTLIRDATSSHLLEIVARSAPEDAFAILWSTYFQGKLSRLANHPVANFVVATALERVTREQLGNVCEELDGIWPKMIKSCRTGVLRAVIDRAAALQSYENEVVNATLSAFELNDADDRRLLVQCALRVVPVPEYRSTLASKGVNPVRTSANGSKGELTTKDDATEPKTQGVILLQSLLRFREPYNQVVIDSIQSLPTEEMITLAHHPTSSRVLDALLELHTVPFKAKRQLVLSFMGHFHQLVDDRIGSRVGDRCWAFADPYLKEKIARSLMPHEAFLAASPYGKFFARNLNLYLLQRRPDEWKTLQAEKKRATLAPPSDFVQAAGSNTTGEESAVPSSRQKRKRKQPPEDEIDGVFNAMKGKQVKKGVLDSSDASARRDKQRSRLANEQSQTSELRDVLSAIRAAPKGEKVDKKRKMKTDTGLLV